MQSIHLRLPEAIILKIENESKVKGIAKTEIMRGYIEAGMLKESTSGNASSVYDALQVFKSDLLADLKRAMPAPVAPPTPNVVTPKIDFTDAKNEIISEVRRAVGSFNLTAQSVPQTPAQSPNSDELLATATSAIEAQNQFSGRLTKVINSLTQITQTTRDAVVELANRPVPTPGISRDEFAELVATVKDEIAANRKFQQVTSDMIGQTMSEMQTTLREIAAKSGDESHVTGLAAQVASLERRAYALFSLLAENTLLSRQYTGEVLRATLPEKMFNEVVDDIQQRDLKETQQIVARIIQGG